MFGNIIGWAHTPFGKLVDETLETLVRRVASEALAHAGVAAQDVDEIVIGHFNQGLDPQGSPASLVLQADPALRFKPATRVENACATGSAAVRWASTQIRSGQAKIVLVIGVEKMTAASAEQVRQALVSASYVVQEGGPEASFTGLFADIAQQYFSRYGDQSDALARIAAKNHRNGALNPLAHMRKDLGLEFCQQVCERNPYVAFPLRRTDCSMISDGAAALVLASDDVALGRDWQIGLRAMTQVNDFLPISRRDITRFEGAAKAWHDALASADLQLRDLDFVETHDCFTIAELIEYEAMGLTLPGQGARAVAEGWTEPDGRLPVNLSGGLKAKGHPIGATGVSMHVMAAMQLAGQAPGLQLASGPRLGGIFNMGGAAVANYVSILERTR
ncbi:acetyl-CoA acetyltransferase [Pseudomonas syringae]|uniref:Acetyl-CoA acetyltransferase n=1 Tax=Pseudomonas syringae TaxID=317 RepID=A0A085V8J0_PSESX|nr:acetyl-CoA acetyltransferase [Pseudomonas syringae]KFE51753.1 acetyl-CoA acetyltransferase [Pseudomonas syringae]